MNKLGTTESMPFDDSTLVFKVGGKMFALVGLKEFKFVNLKCDPHRAIELRAEFDTIRPGYHMNKQHWNSVYLHDGLAQELVLDLIDHSYELIFSSLSKKLEAEIRALD